MSLSTFWEVLKQTFQEWQNDKVSRLAAALSYYTIFSLAPLLVIALAVAGLFISRSTVQQEVIAQVQVWVGDGVEPEVIRNMINAANLNRNSSIVATLISLGVLLFGATNFFFQLQEALNTIWNVEDKTEGSLLTMLWRRFMSFAIVLGVGIFLIFLLVLNTVLAGVSRFLDANLLGISGTLPVLQISVSLLLLTAIFTFLFTVLPDIDVSWKHIWPGALLTAILFGLGQLLIGFYLGQSTIASAYGAAGSLAVLLIWVFYSMQILLTGAEFTHVYARRRSSIAGSDDAH
jgi:membrane protein